MKNEYAFPFKHDISSESIGKTENAGMTLRDYFAAKALQGAVSNPNLYTTNPWEIARIAYQYADAMLEVRSEAN